MSVTVKTLRNGPLLVKGLCALQDGRGEPIDRQEGDILLLCRCGGSERKPFCDGTHRRIGFQG